MSSISSILRMRISSIIYKNNIKMTEGRGQPGQLLDCHWKSMESWGGTNNLVLCTYGLYFVIYKKYLYSNFIGGCHGCDHI
jgi:hypothetical protein